MDQLLHQVIDWSQRFQPERSYQVIVLAGNRHHPVRPEQFAVADQGFHHLGHHLALTAVEDRFLLF